MLNLKETENSIRKQLLSWLLIPLVCLCALTSLIAYRLAQTFANESYDRLLVESAESIASRLKRNEDGIVVADLPPAAQAILRHNGQDKFFYQIADSEGHRLTGDADLPVPINVEEKGPKFRYYYVNGEKVRMCRIARQIPPNPGEIWVQVAETLRSRQWVLQQIFVSIMAPQLILIILASLSVYLGVKHGMRPLDKLGSLLRLRNRTDLSPVDIGKTPSELAPVIKALNDLLANASNQIKQQKRFIADAAHQLRTPVTALTTYVDYSQRIKPGDTDSHKKTLAQMSRAVTRLIHLVNRLLSLARSEETTIKSLDEIDLREVLNEAAGNVIAEALARGVVMEFDLPDNPVLVRADSVELNEMLTNILENAVKYTKDGGSVWVNITQAPSPILSVEDNGPGIPEEERNKIFDRFYRIPGTQGAGCGLGLSIVAEIAANNNINLAIADRPGGGSCFRINFP